jgi:transglutaminase-like putative cysteine protease
MRLRPMTAPGQQVTDFKLTTEPAGGVRRYADRFGNEVHYFDVLMPHQRHVVTARSEVTTTDTPAAPLPAALTLLEAYDYVAASRYAPFSDALRDFAAPLAALSDPAEQAQALMAAVSGALVYERGATDVRTSADAALTLGRGVCQDFAHVMLAACRCLALPARYVSGYLHTPPNGDAELASHAWVDVYLAGQGWLALDPTHNAPPNGHYVRVAVGRDYADVPPTRGVFKGNAKETLGVDVSLTEH